MAGLPVRILLAWIVASGWTIQAQPRPQTKDPVANLNAKPADGSVKLEYRKDRWGYLTSVLEQLDIRSDSQILVFSKTSFQKDLISPAAPRALYFNDDIVL